MILLQLFYLSGGRWSLAAVWHATLNTFGGSFFTAMVIGADQVRYGLLLSGSYTLLAIFAAFLATIAGRTQRSCTSPVPVLTTPQRYWLEQDANRTTQRSSTKRLSG